MFTVTGFGMPFAIAGMFSISPDSLAQPFLMPSFSSLANLQVPLNPQSRVPGHPAVVVKCHQGGARTLCINLENSFSFDMHRPHNSILDMVLEALGW